MSKPVDIGTGLTIGVPTLGRPVPLAWAWAFKSMSPPINYNSVICNIWGKRVADARNEIARESLRNGSKYLMFVGDDTVCPPHTLKQLLFRMENNPSLGVVGGIYCSKSEPAAPLVFRGNGKGSYWDWKVGEYFSVTGLGMDATLIRTEVFKGLTEPWFHTEDSDDFLDGVNHAEQWTEDLYFCKKVLEETEFSIYADAAVICEHHDVYNKKIYSLPAGCGPIAKFPVGNKKIVDIGCGPLYREFPEGKVTRVDIREDCNPDYRCDVRSLPFASDYFDIVFSSHVLEHFPRADWEDVLKEWVRILRPDGEIRLVLPNIYWAAHMIAVEKVINDDVLNVLYGAQSYPHDFHYNGLTPERMKLALKKLGLQMQEPELQGYNMILSARYNEHSNKDDSNKTTRTAKPSVKRSSHKQRTRRK